MHVTMVDEENRQKKTPEGGKPVDSPKTGITPICGCSLCFLGIGATGTGALAFG